MSRGASHPFLREFRRPWLWLGLWLALVAAVVVASLLPARDLPPAPFDGFDKLEHFLAYALMAAGAVLLFARSRTQAAAAIALVALGIGLEFAQGALTVSRAADARDGIANTLGVLAGGLLSRSRWAGALQALDAAWARTRHAGEDPGRGREPEQGNP